MAGLTYSVAAEKGIEMEIIFLIAGILAILASIMLARSGKKKLALAAAIAAVLSLASVFLVTFNKDDKRGCGMWVLTTKDGGDETSLKNLGFRKMDYNTGPFYDLFFQFFSHEKCPEVKSMEGPWAEVQRAKAIKDTQEAAWGKLPPPPENPGLNFALVAVMILLAAAVAALSYSFFAWRPPRQELHH